eukprot:11159103-Lingulodinium_polyedra.AAC.1
MNTAAALTDARNNYTKAKEAISQLIVAAKKASNFLKLSHSRNSNDEKRRLMQVERAEKEQRDAQQAAEKRRRGSTSASSAS